MPRREQPSCPWQARRRFDEALGFRRDAGKIAAGASLDQAALQAAGLARGGKDGVRLLGKGELSAKLSFTVAGASKGAIEAVEKAGGSVSVIEVVAAAEKAAAKKGKGTPSKGREKAAAKA